MLFVCTQPQALTTATTTTTTTVTAPRQQQHKSEQIDVGTAGGWTSRIGRHGGATVCSSGWVRLLAPHRHLLHYTLGHSTNTRTHVHTPRTQTVALHTQVHTLFQVDTGAPHPIHPPLMYRSTYCLILLNTHSDIFDYTFTCSMFCWCCSMP